MSENYNKEIFELFEVMETAKNQMTFIKKFLDAMADGSASEEFKKELLDFFIKYTGYEVVKQDLCDLWSKQFTKEEVVDITEFYKTSSGQKLLSSAEYLLDGNSNLSTGLISEHSDELNEIIGKEASKSLKENPIYQALKQHEKHHEPVDDIGPTRGEA